MRKALIFLIRVLEERVDPARQNKGPVPTYIHARVKTIETAATF